MTDSREEVLKLVATGKITSAEGATLLEAMRGPRPSLLQTLFNPFERLGTWPALALSLGGATVGLGLSRLGARFDGALDVHVVAPPPALVTALVEQLVAWPLVALVLWLAGRALTRKGRFVDLLGVVGVARLPLLGVAAFTTALLDPTLVIGPDGLPAVTPALIVVALTTIPLVVWTIVLAWTGFRTATAARGVSGGVGFTVALLVAELLSKLALSLRFP